MKARPSPINAPRGERASSSSNSQRRCNDMTYAFHTSTMLHLVAVFSTFFKRMSPPALFFCFAFDPPFHMGGGPTRWLDRRGLDIANSRWLGRSAPKYVSRVLLLAHADERAKATLLDPKNKSDRICPGRPFGGRPVVPLFTSVIGPLSGVFRGDSTGVAACVPAFSRLPSRCSFGPHNAIPRATHQP